MEVLGRTNQNLEQNPDLSKELSIHRALTEQEFQQMVWTGKELLRNFCDKWPLARV
jgi:hypothetical protein